MWFSFQPTVWGGCCLSVPGTGGGIVSDSCCGLGRSRWAFKLVGGFAPQLWSAASQIIPHIAHLTKSPGCISSRPQNVKPQNPATQNKNTHQPCSRVHNVDTLRRSHVLRNSQHQLPLASSLSPYRTLRLHILASRSQGFRLCAPNLSPLGRPSSPHSLERKGSHSKYTELE